MCLARYSPPAFPSPAPPLHTHYIKSNFIDSGYVDCNSLLSFGECLSFLGLP